MVAEYFDKTGKLKEEKFTLNEEVFGVKVNKTLLTQSVNTYLANQRQSNANVKTRGEVSGGGRKPWKQKGTGRARASSIRSPLWRGGGVSFGPKTTDNYKVGLSTKMTQNAIRSAFSLKAGEDAVVVYEDIELGKEVKTQKLLKVLKDFGTQKVLIIQPENVRELLLASRNLKNITLKGVNELNTYTILNAKKIIVMEKSFDQINSFWAKGKVKTVKVKTVKAVKEKKVATKTATVKKTKLVKKVTK